MRPNLIMMIMVVVMTVGMMKGQHPIGQELRYMKKTMKKTAQTDTRVKAQLREAGKQ